MQTMSPASPKILNFIEIPFYILCTGTKFCASSLDKCQVIDENIAYLINLQWTYAVPHYPTHVQGANELHIWFIQR